MLAILEKYLPFYLSGIKTTLLLSVFSLIIGLILGTILAIMRLSKVKVLSVISKIYIEIFRGTPLFVQLTMVYVGLSMISPINFSNFTGGLIAVSLNAAAYISEIII